jgi:hypothetical protein
MEEEDPESPDLSKYNSDDSNPIMMHQNLLKTNQDSLC